MWGFMPGWKKQYAHFPKCQTGPLILGFRKVTKSEAASLWRVMYSVSMKNYPSVATASLCCHCNVLSLLPPGCTITTLQPQSTNCLPSFKDNRKNSKDQLINKHRTKWVCLPDLAAFMAVLSHAKDHRTCIQVSYCMLRSTAVMVQASFSLRVKILSQMNLWLGVAGLQVSRVYHRGFVQ